MCVNITNRVRYGLGARGIDVIDRQAFYPSGPQGTVRCFPVYDAHGNCVATISRDGNGGFSLADRRTFDAWGVVRSEQHGNDPRLRYCGSLGHKADDESGLVYMRARYYEPTSGRFLSEDPDYEGANWFTYCKDNPIQGCDFTGKVSTTTDVLLGLAVVCALGGYALRKGGCFAKIGGAVLIVLAAVFFAEAYSGKGEGGGDIFGSFSKEHADTIEHVGKNLVASVESLALLVYSPGGAIAGAAMSVYLAQVSGALIDAIDGD